MAMNTASKPKTPFKELYTRVDPEIARSLLAFRRDHPLKQIQVGGTTWDYVALGQGDEAVLFLHGMAGAYDIWWQQIEALKDRFHLISVTYPAVKGLEALRQGITAILAREGVPTANVVGSSLGGYLAQYLVARQPEQFARAVFANTFPPNDLLTQKYRLAGMLLPLLPERLVLGTLGRKVEQAIYPAAGNSELVRAFLLEQARGGMSKARFVSGYRCVIEPFDPPDPQALGIPVLIIEADNDPLVEAALRRMLQATYPSAWVHTFQGGGHFPYLNEAEAYTRVLQRFLAEETQDKQKGD